MWWSGEANIINVVYSCILTRIPASFIKHIFHQTEMPVTSLSFNGDGISPKIYGPPLFKRKMRISKRWWRSAQVPRSPYTVWWLLFKLCNIKCNKRFVSWTNLKTAEFVIHVVKIFRVYSFNSAWKNCFVALSVLKNPAFLLLSTIDWFTIYYDGIKTGHRRKNGENLINYLITNVWITSPKGYF